MRTEHEDQRLFVQWFRRTYPGVRIFAIPNGGARNAAVAMKLKLEGVEPGVPDLFVPEWDMWIEMKREAGGRLSPAQKDWLEYLTFRCEHTVLVGYGLEDAKQKVQDSCTYRVGDI